MPPTENCALGTSNKTRIDAREKICDEFRLDVKQFMAAIDQRLDELTNHFSKKPTWFIALVLVGLTNILTAIIMGLIISRLVN
jgi:hypothetical protein